MTTKKLTQRNEATGAEIESLRAERDTYKRVAQMVGGCRVCRHYKGYGFCAVEGTGSGCDQWSLNDNAKTKASRKPYQKGGAENA